MLTARVIPFTLPLRSAMTTANGTETARSGFLVGLSDDGELWGWGEATPMPPWSVEDAPTTETALRQWVERWCTPAGQANAGAATDLVPGPSSVATDLVPGPSSVATDLVPGPSSVGWGNGHDLGDGALVELCGFPHAAAAVSGALEDLAARRAGRSLGHQLRPSRNPAVHVPVSALIGGADPDVLCSAAVAALELGCSTAKIKVAAGAPTVDVERVAAVRDAVGPTMRLRLDANGGWDHATAVSTLRSLEPHDIELCEEPVGGVEGLAVVRRQVGVPIAIDESLTSLGSFDAVIATGAADVVICKPQALGGPRPAIDLADRATEAGLAVVVTSFIDGTIGLVTALHVASLLPTSGPAHGLATSRLLAVDNAPPLPIIDGALHLPTGAGLGISPTI